MAAGDKPNVLLLISDDCRTSQSCYGGPVRTPNIDRLAERGLRFDRAYCQYPLCNPSRASFMTGLRPDTLGVKNNATNFRTKHPEVVTLPQLFKQHDYFVARVGKIYHYGVPGQIGTDGMDDQVSWEEVVNPRGRDCDDEDKIFSIVSGPTATVTNGSRKYGGTLSWLASEGNDAEQTDGKIAAQACRLLRENRDKPFFLGVGFFRPHTPYVSPQSYFDKYPTNRIRLATNTPEDRATKPPTALTVFPPHYGMDENLQRTVQQAYYASTAFMDAQLGVVLDELDRLKLANKTIVIFISDHGYHLGEHGLWQKMTTYEESARVPMIIAAPGMKARGKTTERLAELVDLYPTIAELCGLRLPDGLEGTSLTPLLNNPERSWKQGAFTEVIHARGGGRADSSREPRIESCGRSVRSERFRYTEWSDGADGAELYDHKKDPGEQRNLINDPKSVKVLEEMKLLLKNGWQAARP